MSASSSTHGRCIELRDAVARRAHATAPRARDVGDTMATDEKQGCVSDVLPCQADPPLFGSGDYVHPRSAPSGAVHVKKSEYAIPSAVKEAHVRAPAFARCQGDLNRADMPEQAVRPKADSNPLPDADRRAAFMGDLPPLLLPRLVPRAHLRVFDQLGHGAFGVVYKGELRRSGVSITVAVKILDLAQDLPLGFVADEAVRAFYWEALNLALVDHPHIVELLGVCVDPDTELRAIIMEYCPGGDLHHALSAPLPRVWRWATQLAEALRYLHASGQVHRDIKSENVLLTANDSAKFADLGVADADEEFVGTRLGGVRGFSQKDVRWAAPEEIAIIHAQVNLWFTPRPRARN
jgi:hypothetical protein